MIEIYDDILPSDLIDELEKNALSPNNCWNYDYKTMEDKFNISSKNIQETFQFRSLIKTFDMIYNENAYNLVLEIFKLIQKKLSYCFNDPFRIKYNLLSYNINQKEDTHNTPHIDSNDDHYVLLYYVNESDGPTYIFNETKKEYDMENAYKFKDFTIKQKVEPKRGRFILFDGDYYHTSSSPQRNNKRFVLNINIAKENCLL